MKFIFIFLAFLTASAFAQSKSNPTINPEQAKLIFQNVAMVKAREVLESHFEKHPKCELKPILESLAVLRIYYPPEGTFSFKVRARAIPTKTKLHKLMEVNLYLPWDLFLAVRTLIHELTHVTYLESGTYLCGEDLLTDYTRSRRMSFPACRMFGKIQYHSEQITQDIEDHLKAELAKLRTENKEVIATK